MSTAADDAVAYVLRRIRQEPEIAYYFGHTEALARLMKAYAEAKGLDPAEFEKQYMEGFQTSAPRCRNGCIERQEAH